MWLLDTNVVSELARKSPATGVLNWLEGCPLQSLHVSEVTFAEIRFGIEVSADPLKRTGLREWLEHVIRPMFASRVLSVTEEVLFVWRGLATAAQKRGMTMPQADALIAASAREANLSVCTRDVAPFIACGLPVLNPWTGERFNGA
jgi:hypothetical protein